jgi:hypothetical protein
MLLIWTHAKDALIKKQDSLSLARLPFAKSLNQGKCDDSG